MKKALILPVLVCLQAGGLAAAPDSQQGFDPLRSATGWARVDKDGSCTFYDPATKTLDTWSKDFGIIGILDLSKLEAPPEKWVIDPYGNAWIVSGSTLYRVDKNGKPSTTVKLPAEVVDLAWDTKGFVLLFQGPETYLEKREYSRGSMIWSFGKKPKNGEGGPAVPQRMAISEDGHVLVASGGSLALQTYDGGKGTPLGETVFSLQHGAAPSLVLAGKDRGALAWWLGQNVAFAAVPASQVPSERKSGLLLARLDLAAGTVEFLPTGVPEDHKLLGVTELEAILLKPGGGLVLVPVK